MNKTIELPKTMLEAIRAFSDPDFCLELLVSMRWPKGVTCPRCEGKESYFLSTRRIWKCRGCKKQFSIKVGTIFEDSSIGLDKWLSAMWLLAAAKNGISSWELHRSLGVTQKTAWFMLHRLRRAMQSGSIEKLKGAVEVDETFIGGKARNMHAHKRAEKIHGRGMAGKVTVMGLLERHGTVRAKVVSDTKRKTLAPEVRANVEPGAEVFTDALKSYYGLSPEYVHQVIDHAEAYVDGQIHTNGMENFWSLLKRMLKGTYVQVEPFHLFRYLDEEAYRFNNRATNDGERFKGVLAQIVGRRLTYKQLTGNVDSDEPACHGVE